MPIKRIDSSLNTGYKIGVNCEKDIEDSGKGIHGPLVGVTDWYLLDNTSGYIQNVLPGHICQPDTHRLFDKNI